MSTCTEGSPFPSPPDHAPLRRGFSFLAVVSYLSPSQLPIQCTRPTSRARAPRRVGRAAAVCVSALMAPAAAPGAARPSRIARLLSGVTAAGGVAGRRRMPRRASRRYRTAALLGVGILRRLLAEPEVFPSVPDVGGLDGADDGRRRQCAAGAVGISLRLGVTGRLRGEIVQRMARCLFERIHASGQVA